MKKIVKVLLLCALVLGVLGSFNLCFASERIAVSLDGKILSFDQNPIITEGRTLVPLRGIFEAMGAEVLWDEDARCVSAKKDGTEIKLTIGENVIYKNGEAISLDVPTQIVNSRTLVPVRAVSESLGAFVSWNDAERKVVINSDALLGATLAKLEQTEEIVLEAEGKITYTLLPFDVKIKGGVDFKNEKAFLKYTASALLASASGDMVYGNGKIYTKTNEGTEIKDASDIEMLFDLSCDAADYTLAEETEKAAVYIADALLNGQEISATVILDKALNEFTKISVSKDVLEKFADGFKITSDFEAEIKYNTGDTIKAWNEFEK